MVTHDFPPRLGGIASHVFELSRELANLGQDVTIIAPSPKRQWSYELSQNIRVYCVRERLLQQPDLRFVTLASLISYVARAHRILRRVIKNHRIDVVHYHNLTPESLITKGLSGWPIVFTAHESYFLKLAAERQRRISFYLSHVDYLIAPSQELLRQGLSYCKPTYGSRYLPNGVNVKKFSPDGQQNSLRDRHGISGTDRVILSARRLVEKNGVIYLIEAIPFIAKQLEKNFKVVILGDGEEAKRIRKRIKELKVEQHIVWVGPIENDNMPDYYSMADLVVLPSLKEATSITGLEALACGKPLIGTTVGGIPALIDHGENGLLVPPEKSFQLADAIVNILSDPHSPSQMGMYGRQKAVNNFSWEKIAQETLEIYERCHNYKSNRHS